MPPSSRVRSDFVAIKQKTVSLRGIAQLVAGSARDAQGGGGVAWHSDLDEAWGGADMDVATNGRHGDVCAGESTQLGFDDELLEGAGRSHTSEDARRAVEMIKEAGITNWSLDLIR